MSTTAMSLSRLVETISLNVDDFSESFLTCPTCLNQFDGASTQPKLLACSHTVCRMCLEKIATLPQCRGTGHLRCPICRETILLPSPGGVSGLPPSFLVNQLIDLISRQRKDFLPRCSAHSAQELLFCESCDIVFCPQCIDTHDPGSIDSAHDETEHVIVPFSVALKRMSEILLYKTGSAAKLLTRAAQSTAAELAQLEANTAYTLAQVNASFEAMESMLAKRRAAIIDRVQRIKEDKEAVLTEQARIVEQERSKVEACSEELNSKLEVRDISRRICDLNLLLDSAATLTEPRENAYIRLALDQASLERDVDDLLEGAFRCLHVSKTFPPLCTVRTEGGLATKLRCYARVSTVDYHGSRRTTGGDPVEVRMWRATKVDSSQSKVGPRRASESVISPPCRNSLNDSMRPVSYDGSPTKLNNHVVHNPKQALPSPLLHTTVSDNEDGTYDVCFTPDEPGAYYLEVYIFGRAIKNSPFLLFVSPHHNPVWRCALSLAQPCGVVSASVGAIHVLETGANCVRVLTCDGNTTTDVITDAQALSSASCTAMARTQQWIYLLNWRTKTVSQLDLTGTEVRHFTCSDFVEPVCLAVNDDVIVIGDAATCVVYVFDTQTASYKCSFNITTHLTAATPKRLESSVRQSMRKLKSQERMNTDTTEDKSPKINLSCTAMTAGGDLFFGGSAVIRLDRWQSQECTKLHTKSHTTSTSAITSEAESRIRCNAIKMDPVVSATSLAVDSTTHRLLVAGHTLRCAASVVCVIDISDMQSALPLFFIDSAATRLRNPAALCLDAAIDGHFLAVDTVLGTLVRYRYI